MIRIEELRLNLAQDEEILQQLAATILHISVDAVRSCTLIKKSIDSRKKSDIFFVYTVDITVDHEKQLLAGLAGSGDTAIQRQLQYHRVRHVEPFYYNIPSLKYPENGSNVVVGAGPCGMFAALALAKAGLRPVVLERGKSMEERIRDVDLFFKNGMLNPESNVQFGEGGAGTFSDGKLYTLINDKRTSFIFQTLADCGAPNEILYDAKPHIGTDILRKVMTILRKKIVALGGIFRFETKLTGVTIKKGALTGIILNDKEEMPVSNMILAIGHSARDTFEMLFNNGIVFQQKAFSVGVRIEHPAVLINKAQYGNFYDHKKLSPAKYKLAAHLKNGRSVYTFCMCPGGYVVAAASEQGGVVVNGMSESRQDGINSNSAVLVNVHPSDFGSDHPLSGIDFQRNIERKAFKIGGNNYFAPAQLLEDFLKGRPSGKFSGIRPTYLPGIIPANLSDCLPKYIMDCLKAGIMEMDKKLRGFASSSAIVTAPETRSSSPVRILRNTNGESFSVKNLFPAGEGAGYAGGIVSSAIDGLRTAEAIIEKIAQ